MNVSIHIMSVSDSVHDLVSRGILFSRRVSSCAAFPAMRKVNLIVRIIIISAKSIVLFVRLENYNILFIT